MYKRQIIGCAKAFSELDATMVEVNPLVISKQKQILALDCKMSFDNNAMFRRSQVSELRDKTQEETKEVYASDRGLNYVSLDGNIGNIINGVQINKNAILAPSINELGIKKNLKKNLWIEIKTKLDI